MAAIAQIDVEKMALGETFTNRYLVDIEPGNAGAISVINVIVDAEKQMMYDNVTFLRVRHSTLAPDDDDYTMTILSGTGARGLASDHLLPLFNVVRIDFQPTAGRPSRKYLRGCIAEGDVEGHLFIAGYEAGHAAGYIASITGNTHIVDPQGDDLVTGKMWPFVGMRQLRRGSKRKLGPVL